MPGLTELFGMEATWVRCPSCGLPFQVPKYVYEWAVDRKKHLHCPYGHSMAVYGEESEEKIEKLRHSVDFWKERHASANRCLAAARGQLTKLKKRKGQ